MTPFALTILFASCIAILLVPRRWACLPFLVGACFLTQGQRIDLGPFTFFPVRVLIAVGFIRVALRNERHPGGVVALDIVMVLFACWAAISSVFHYEPKNHLISVLGTSYDALGTYFLFRSLCATSADARQLARVFAVILIPVAIAMVYEVATMKNLFSAFGGVRDIPMVRDGRIRASGPFRHAILAGTVGGIALPLTLSMWPKHAATVLIGSCAALLMILTSASSGPVLTAMASIGALCMWPYRAYLSVFRWFVLITYIVLSFVMSRPAYYIVQYLDITGSSASYHRARVIESGFEHLNEWWLAGTDYTRHWMPTGVSWSPDHSDLTNHYLALGVVGGLPLALLFIAQLALAFRYAGRGLSRQDTQLSDKFLLWSFASCLFAHVVSCLSVSYFDQSLVFLYMPLGVIVSLAHQPEQSALSRTRRSSKINDVQYWNALPQKSKSESTKSSSEYRDDSLPLNLSS